jgi:flavodoxin
MKSLVVFYSRSGATGKVAARIAQTLGCEIEEIFPKRKYAGPIGFIRAALEATRKKLPEISELKNDIGGYDLLILGTPMWSGSVASPMRSYIERQDGRFKKVAFFLTKGGASGTRIFKEMERLCEKTPLATLELRTGEIKNDGKFKAETLKKIDAFAEHLK